MALNLKTLGTRSLSGAVFVVLLMGSLWWNYYSFSLFFMLMAMMGLNEFYKIALKLNAQPFRVEGFIAGILLYIGCMRLDYLLPGYDLHRFNFVPLLVLLSSLTFTAALFSKREQPVLNALFTLSGVLYAVLPFGLMHAMTYTATDSAQTLSYNPELLVGVILLIWSNDTFAYLGGSLFGKHKMIARISPGKTWEGTLFGIAVTFGISFLLRGFVSNSPGSHIWLALGVLVPIAATVGDLIESMLKRQAGIKDSGNIMPGHGGVLDRFDSLIFVMPIVFVLLKLL